uniref:Uncharacterized protein n=1 Tax=Arundo donax TaxID=35708 RepID=A0A0A9FA27_ARUDO
MRNNILLLLLTWSRSMYMMLHRCHARMCWPGTLRLLFASTLLYLLPGRLLL